MSVTGVWKGATEYVEEEVIDGVQKGVLVCVVDNVIVDVMVCICKGVIEYLEEGVTDDVEEESLSGVAKDVMIDFVEGVWKGVTEVLRDLVSMAQLSGDVLYARKEKRQGDRLSSSFDSPAGFSY